MLVTLDVSKLSGWLKLDVIYRVKRRTYDTGREVRTAGAGKAAHTRNVEIACVDQSAPPPLNLAWAPP